MPWHDAVLGADQRRAVDAAASALEPYGAALAGGLALAWRFGHRRSRDMDWFLPAQGDGLAVAEAMARIGVEVDQAEPGTVVGRWLGVPFSLIRYRYRLERDPAAPVPMVDLRTAMGMKLLAVVNRGTRRDLIDVAACLEHGMDLPTLLSWAETDVPGLTVGTLLRCLVYHDEAAAEPDPEGLEADGWVRAATRLRVAVRQLVQAGGDA